MPLLYVPLLSSVLVPNSNLACGNRGRIAERPNLFNETLEDVSTPRKGDGAFGVVRSLCFRVCPAS